MKTHILKAAVARKICAALNFVLVLQGAGFVLAQERGAGVRPKETAPTEKRLALVIGNSTYQFTGKLENPVNDANDMTATLKSLGFEVISGMNQTLPQMRRLVRDFGAKLAQQKGVGLFYYAGHGIQASGRNYLIPVEAEIASEVETEDVAMDINSVLRQMDAAGNGFNIVILDACRNNPFARSWNRDIGSGGLAQINAPTGTLIAYATAPGDVANDGSGKNGLYTSELLKQMRRSGATLEEVFKSVRAEVRRKSGGRQVPWESSSVEGDFYFAGAGVNPPPQTNAATTADPPIVAKDRASIEREAWSYVRNSVNPQDFRDFLKDFPDGANAGSAKIKLEQSVWDSVKDSRDRGRIQSYLNEFPDGANAPLARIKLRQLETPTSTTSSLPPSSVLSGNRSTQDKESLYGRFTGCYKETDRQKRDACYAIAKEYLDKYEVDNDEFGAFVRRRYDAYSKSVLTVSLIERFNNSIKDVNAVDADEAFSSGKDIIAQNPDLIDVPIVLASIGFDNAAAKTPNDKYNYDAINYAKMAIQKMKAGKTSQQYGAYAYTYVTRDFPDGKSNTLGWMNYTIGYIMFNRLNQKREALSFLYEATQFNSGTKTFSELYRTIGSWYVTEFIRLDKERVDKIKAAGDKDTNETLLLLALQKGYADRAIEAYARAYKVAGSDPANKAYKDSLLNRAKELYGIRFNNDMSGFDAYMAKVMDRPFTDPTSAVSPVVNP